MCYEKQKQLVGVKRRGRKHHPTLPLHPVAHLPYHPTLPLHPTTHLPYHPTLPLHPTTHLSHTYHTPTTHLPHTYPTTPPYHSTLQHTYPTTPPYHTPITHLPHTYHTPTQNLPYHAPTTHLPYLYIQAPQQQHVYWIPNNSDKTKFKILQQKTLSPIAESSKSTSMSLRQHKYRELNMEVKFLVTNSNTPWQWKNWIQNRNCCHHRIH